MLLDREYSLQSHRFISDFPFRFLFLFLFLPNPLIFFAFYAHNELITIALNLNRPIFDKITLRLPPNPFSPSNHERTLTISSSGAPSKPYVNSLTMNGRKVDLGWPVLAHEELFVNGDGVVMLEFEMSDGT
jgi:putative alpha-1,2-mannosidase